MVEQYLVSSWILFLWLLAYTAGKSIAHLSVKYSWSSVQPRIFYPLEFTSYAVFYVRSKIYPAGSIIIVLVESTELIINNSVYMHRIA